MIGRAADEVKKTWLAVSRSRKRRRDRRAIRYNK